MSELYIGLMSGTSADGIDLALVDFSNKKPVLLKSHYCEYRADIKTKVTQLYCPGVNEIDQMGELAVELAYHYADAIKQLLALVELSPQDIAAIGNHGQTVRHRPNAGHPFTLQIGCNQTLAVLTGIRVIGDFRTKDMALGGQGAPLVPAFHQQFLSLPDRDVVVLNIGGIANITFLPADESKNVVGFDTGPGNALMDDWYYLHHQKNFDAQGKWAASGSLDNKLLQNMLSDSYFAQPYPKSTGREYFNLPWLNSYLECSNYPEANVQNTLCHLTATSIAMQIKQLSKSAVVYLCGGGYRNNYLVDLLEKNLKGHNIYLTNQQGIDPDFLESMAFAWFAHAYDKKIFGNMPAVTGAKSATVLGCEFFPA